MPFGITTIFFVHFCVFCGSKNFLTHCRSIAEYRSSLQLRWLQTSVRTSCIHSSSARVCSRIHAFAHSRIFPETPVSSVSRSRTSHAPHSPVAAATDPSTPPTASSTPSAAASPDQDIHADSSPASSYTATPATLPTRPEKSNWNEHARLLSTNTLQHFPAPPLVGPHTTDGAFFFQ